MKKRNSPFTNAMTIIFIMVFAVSCMPSTSNNSLRSREKFGLFDTSKLKVGEGRVLLDNPIILSNNANFTVNGDLNRLLSAPVFITSNSFLQENPNCQGLQYCFQVQDQRTSAVALQTTDGKWGYAVGTEEFNQVNLFYHMSQNFNRFLGNIDFTLQNSYIGSAVPFNIVNFNGTYNLNNTVLLGISNCDAENNASFENETKLDKVYNLVCFGFTNTPTVPLRWVHDSTIINHELGHFFQALQINFRNSASLVKAEMGSAKGYAESGSLGEGLADYYSYYINGRTHLGEWAAGRLGASRPIIESDLLHSAALSSDRDQRLYYPEYLDYDANAQGVPVEGVHNSGMIMSHFLVALTEDLQEKCSITKKIAQEHVMQLISETMAELGDLTTRGTNNNLVDNKINLNRTYAKKWIDVVNPINYRSFSQTIAKNILINLGNSDLNRCGGFNYQKDHLESLLDDYGLLLFKTYNQHRNLSNGTTLVNTSVTATNRKKSVLVAKSAIGFDPAPEASIAFVIDDQKDIKDALAAVAQSGLGLVISNLTPPDLGYNNGNSKISPGEIVAIAMNIYNGSNSSIGGVQVLANDWDHADKDATGKTFGHPCQFNAALSNDQWPLESEGGSVAPNCSTVEATTAADFAPVCFIQFNDLNSTKWISQKKFRDKISLDNNLCLNPAIGEDKDCFIRAIKGLDTAHFSKINAKSTWAKTFTNAKTQEAPEFTLGNLFFLEVSKHIPPGTEINCRLRVRFSNCEDCFHDAARSSYDYEDKYYNGPKPYKVIHLQFRVTD